MSDMKKKIIRGVAVLAMAGATGHYVQQSAALRQTPETAAETLSVKPENLKTLAATDQPVASEPTIALPPLASLPENPPSALKVAPPSPAVAPAAAPAAAPVVQAAVAPSAGPDCAPTLDLLSDDMAMIGVTLIAPCHGDQEFTLRHNGLAIAMRTNATGSFFAFIPALANDGTVSVAFKDGQELTSSVEVPALDGLRRVALIWQTPDAFGIHALEGEARYGDAAAVTYENPKTPVPGTLPSSGYLTRLGDKTKTGGLMADVYTYPTHGQTDAEVLFEAAVTPDTCGREVFAEVIQTEEGKATSKELVMSLPECDGESGFLVLNNPAREQSIAALN